MWNVPNERWTEVDTLDPKCGRQAFAMDNGWMYNLKDEAVWEFLSESESSDVVEATADGQLRDNGRKSQARGSS
jgi:hypothetical protein